MGMWVGFFWMVNVHAAPSMKPSPSVLPVAVPSVLPSLSPSPLPSPSHSIVPLLPDEAKSLVKQFKKAQQAEMKGLEHRQKLEIQELKASQSARQKEWDLKEKEARHKFFAENREGPVRREFVKDFLERRKSMHSILKQEMHDRENDQKVRRESLKAEHTDRRTQFEKLTSSGVRPPADLWPTPGR